MKKIKRFITPTGTSKYSETFYRRILFRSSALIVSISTVLLLFFVVQTIKTRMQDVTKNLQTENETCFTTVNEVLDNAKRISMFFAYYKDYSPLYQHESNIDVREVMLTQEAKAFYACFDFLQSISIKTPETSVIYGDVSYLNYKKIAFSDPFNIYATAPDAFPHLLKLSYVPDNTNTFAVELTLRSKYLCAHYMSGNSYLLAPDGRILLSQDENLLGKSISDVIPIEYKTICNGNRSSKYLYASQRYLENEQLHLVTIIPKAVVYHGTIGQLLSMLLIYLVLLTISITFLSYVLGYLYRPIKDVAQVLKYYMPDNDTLIESDAVFIKNCMRRYGIAEDVDAAALSIRKSQLQTLHAQISPHLLGNSLEAIKWRLIPIVGDDSMLVRSVSSLSMFLTEIYEYKNLITSIHAEIERTKRYTDMMIYCFYPEMQVEWEIIDEGLMNCAIVSLTLQPFIENSIEHGFSYMEEIPRISIRITSDDNTIFIEIADNGEGMDEETLKNIRHTLSNDEPTSHHIGIKNSHLKLKLLFGPDYGVTEIDSNSEGTYIRLAIPKVTSPMTLPHGET